jgi:hypothetical protein
LAQVLSVFHHNDVTVTFFYIHPAAQLQPALCKQPMVVEALNIWIASKIFVFVSGRTEMLVASAASHNADLQH